VVPKGRAAVPRREQSHPPSRFGRLSHEVMSPGGHGPSPPPTTLAPMKAILHATLAAVLSGILVGYLLKKKVADLGPTNGGVER
jgi:hypothetical protein